ncbi:MAG: transposase [Candidatus Fermentibacterota bacterium]
MPTLKRISLPGHVYHVFSRAAEGRRLFREERELVDLLARIEAAATATRVNVYAWAVTPTRLHFLLRTGREPLTLFVSRIVSGYAIATNRRRGETGSLFAGRYRSVLVEEERYFMEVLGYVHTLPLQERLVHTPEGLDAYSWSGHAALLGRRSFPWQDTVYVLNKFAGDLLQGRKLYAKFIREAVGRGAVRTDLNGGGLLRSASLEGLGISAANVNGHDPRTLGSARFTRSRLQRFEEMEDWPEEVRRAKAEALQQVVQHALEVYDLDMARLLSRSKRNAVSDARGLICYVACFVIGLPYSAPAEALGISASGAYMAARRGRRLAESDPGLLSGLELPIG